MSVPYHLVPNTRSPTKLLLYLAKDLQSHGFTKMPLIKWAWESEYGCTKEQFLYAEGRVNKYHSFQFKIKTLNYLIILCSIAQQSKTLVYSSTIQALFVSLAIVWYPITSYFYYWYWHHFLDIRLLYIKLILHQEVPFVDQVHVGGGC